MLARFGLLAVVGCTAYQRSTPAYFAEGSHVLEPGAVGITGAGGAGIDMGGHAIGASARVRVGVGGDQEVGVEASFLDVTRNEGDSGALCCAPPSSSVQVESGSIGGKLSWKYGASPDLAVIAGAGVMHTTNVEASPDSFEGFAISGDVGVVYEQRAADARLYVGLRLGASTTVGHVPVDIEGTGNTFAIVTGTFGAEVPVTHAVHAFVEAGPTILVNGLAEAAGSLGAYGLGGFGVTLGR